MDESGIPGGDNSKSPRGPVLGPKFFGPPRLHRYRSGHGSRGLFERFVLEGVSMRKDHPRQRPSLSTERSRSSTTSRSAASVLSPSSSIIRREGPPCRRWRRRGTAVGAHLRFCKTSHFT